jgi:CHAD domain-containing protein
MATGEQTLRVHALFRLPPLHEVVPDLAKLEQQPTQTLTEVTFDSEDLRLFRWGVTLQRGTGGDADGWQLLLPVEGHGGADHDEVLLPASADDVLEVPQALRDIVTPLLREAPLVPVATLRTERTPFLLIDVDGERVAELVDDTVSILDGEHVAARFRELAVLSTDAAATELLAAVGEVLIEHGAVLGGGSRAANALGPRASAAPDVVLRGPVCPADPAADAVRAHLALQAQRFLLQDVRVRRDLPDSVHQMRVAARRLRSGLKVFGPLLDPEWAGQLREELGWAAGELGKARDTEVLLARLDDHADELPPADAQLATEALERVLRAQLAEARAEALASLRSQRHLQLLEQLVDAVHHPRLTELANEPCGEVLPPMVDKAFRRLARDVKDLRIEGAAEPWHETRIAGKKARYAAELVQPVFGAPAKRLAKALAGVTEVLGDHQDCYVAQQELRRIARREDIDGATGFALGLLHAAEEEREMSLRDDFVALWPAVQKLYGKTVLA